MTIAEGTKFPEFSLLNQDNEPVSLSDFPGWWTVLYVYPKDDTPGCTIQGKAFTASKQDFDNANIKVLGLSADDVDSHRSFCDKFAFTIDLLADPNLELLTALGIEQTEHNGAKYWKRTSFVIDPEGTVRKVYQSVVPTGHEQVLLEDIKKLQQEVAA